MLTLSLLLHFLLPFITQCSMNLFHQIKLFTFQNRMVKKYVKSIVEFKEESGITSIIHTHKINIPFYLIPF